MCWFFVLLALESRHTSQPPKNCHPKKGKNSLANGSFRDAFGYVELFHGWNWDKVTPSTDATCLPSTVINIHTHHLSASLNNKKLLSTTSEATYVFLKPKYAFLQLLNKPASSWISCFKALRSICLPDEPMEPTEPTAADKLQRCGYDGTLGEGPIPTKTYPHLQLHFKRRSWGEGFLNRNLWKFCPNYTVWHNLDSSWNKGILPSEKLPFWEPKTRVDVFYNLISCVPWNITGDLEDVFFGRGNEGWNVWEKWFDDREHSCLIYSSVSKLEHDIASRKPYAESGRHSCRSNKWCQKIANHMRDLCRNGWIFWSHNSIHVRFCGNWT